MFSLPYLCKLLQVVCTGVHHKSPRNIDLLFCKTSLQSVASDKCGTFFFFYICFLVWGLVGGLGGFGLGFFFNFIFYAT